VTTPPAPGVHLNIKKIYPLIIYEEKGQPITGAFAHVFVHYRRYNNSSSSEGS
jgi:hypothetical protein